MFGRPDSELLLYFDLDKYNLRPEAAIKLDDATQFLTDNPETFIIIEATQYDSESDIDTQGYDFGLLLSINRAKAIKKYLVNKGIDSNRIEGYGIAQYLNQDSTHTENQLQLMRFASLRIYTKK